MIRERVCLLECLERWGEGGKGGGTGEHGLEARRQGLAGAGGKGGVEEKGRRRGRGRRRGVRVGVVGRRNQKKKKIREKKYIEMLR